MQTTTSLWLSFLLSLFAAKDGWLGVFLSPSDAEKAVVTEVVPGSPADKAGILAGDVLVSVDEHAVPTRDAFVQAIRSCKAGQRVKIEVLRGTRKINLVIRLGERPANEDLPEPKSIPEEGDAIEVPTDPRPERRQGPDGRPRSAFLGVRLEPADEGLRVTRVIDGSPAAAAGVRPGLVLTTWGQTAVHGFEDVERLLAAAHPGERVALQFRSGSGVESLLVTLGSTSGPADASGAKGRPVDAMLEDAANWSTDLAAAIASKKPVLALFGAAWNGTSMAQRRAFSVEDVREVLGDAQLVYIDTDAHGDLAEKHGVLDLPLIEWIEDGEVAARRTGYLPPADLRSWILEVRRRKEPAARPPRSAGAALDRDAAAFARRTDAGENATVREELRRIREELRALRRLIEELNKRGGAPAGR